MSTLAVLAHYDRHGAVADHVVYQADRLRAAADRLVVVSSCALTAAGRARLAAAADSVIERDNRGYDFGAWRAGLLSVPDWPEQERVIIANDSVVGPLRPVADLLAGATTDIAGITMSRQAVPHVQSYFMAFGPAALRLPTFQAFWREMALVDDRTQVIQRYELGLGRLAAEAGLTASAYFTATPHEERLMAARIASHHRRGAAGAVAGAAAYALQPVRQVMESPVLGLWDRVFDDARLPVVKVSLFSRNPYRIDRASVLARLTDQYPAAFNGFHAYLERLGVRW